MRRVPDARASRLVLRRRVGESIMFRAPTGERLTMRLERREGIDVVLVFEGDAAIRVLRGELREHAA